MTTHRALSAILAALIVILLGTSCSQLANIKASISGTVYMDGRPVAFGTVQAINETGQVVASERTGSGGHYILKDLDPGRYTLVYINAQGALFGKETIVEVRRGRFETVDLELSMTDRVPMGGR